MDSKDDASGVESNGADSVSSWTSPLLIAIELPAIDAHTNLCFTVKPGRQGHVWEVVEELVHGLLMDTDELVPVEKDCSVEKMDTLRKHASTELEHLQANLRMVDEWKRKVSSAGEQMNRMRNSYYKELLHLKEQVYRQQQADQNGDASWRPTFALHFDPSEYHMDDEVTRLVQDKVQLIQQECAFKMESLEESLRSRVSALNESLVVSNMKLHRKDEMIEILMRKHGYKDEKDLSDQLGSIKDVPAEEIAESIERKVQSAENKARQQSTKQKTIQPQQVGESCMDTESPPDLLSDSFGDSVRTSLKSERNSRGPAGITSGVANMSPLPDLFSTESSSDVSSCESLVSGGTGSSSKKSKQPSQQGSGDGAANRWTQLRSAVKGGFKARQPSRKNTRTRKDLSKEACQGGSAVQRRSSVSVCHSGTDPIPYQEAFRKVNLISQACQSTIDAQLLDKAMEYFDKVAENKWNELAGMFSVESPKNQPSNDQEMPDLQDEFNCDDMLSEPHTNFKRCCAGAGHGQPVASGTSCPEYSSADTVQSSISSKPESLFCGKELGSSCSTDASCTVSAQAFLGPTDKADQEVQCCSSDILCPDWLSEQHSWQDDEPFQDQLKRLEHMTSKIESALPLMMARAEKLTNMSGCDSAQKLLVRLVKSISAPASATSPSNDSQPSHPSAQAASTSTANIGSEFPPERLSLRVEEVLQRHGIPVDESFESERTNFSGEQGSKPFASSIRGLVGEAARMSFGTMGRRTFGSTAASQQGTAGKSAFSPKASDSSASAELAINDVFRNKRKTAVLPRRFALADASKALSDKLRRRSFGDEPLEDEASPYNLAIRGGDSPSVAESTSSRSPNPPSDAFLVDPAPAERSSQVGKSRGTSGSEAPGRLSLGSVTDSVFSDCDSLADHLEDNLMDEFPVDAKSADKKNAGSLLASARKGLARLSRPTFERSTFERGSFSSPNDTHDADLLAEPGKLPNINFQRQARRDTPTLLEAPPVDLLLLSEEAESSRDSFNVKKVHVQDVSQSSKFGERRSLGSRIYRSPNRSPSAKCGDNSDEPLSPCSIQQPAGNPPSRPRLPRRFPLGVAAGSRGASDR